MNKKFGIHFDVLMLLLMAAVFVVALDLEYFDLKLLPLMVSGAGFILMAAGLANTVRQKRKAAGAVGDAAPAQPTGIYARYSREGLWLVGFFAGIYLVGFTPAMLIFITAYLRANRVAWGVSAGPSARSGKGE